MKFLFYLYLLLLIKVTFSFKFPFYEKPIVINTHINTQSSFALNQQSKYFYVGDSSSIKIYDLFGNLIKKIYDKKYLIGDISDILINENNGNIFVSMSKNNTINIYDKNWELKTILNKTNFFQITNKLA